MLLVLYINLREKWEKNKKLQYYYSPVVDAPSNDDKRKVMLEILSGQWETLKMDKEGEAVLALEAKIKKLEKGEYVQAHRIIDNLSRMEGTEDIIGQIRLAGDGTHPRFIIARCEALSEVLLRHFERLDCMAAFKGVAYMNPMSCELDSAEDAAKMLNDFADRADSLFAAWERVRPRRRRAAGPAAPGRRQGRQLV